MKIHRRIIATEIEVSRKPCVQCHQPFELHEILTCVDLEGNDPMFYWVCEECMERHFGHLLRQGWRKTWKIRTKEGRREDIDWNGAA